MGNILITKGTLSKFHKILWWKACVGTCPYVPVTAQVWVVTDLMGRVGISEIQHVPRAENVRVDILSKLASTKMGGSNKSVIQETLKTPSIAESVSVLAIEESPSWMAPIMRYLLGGAFPSDLWKRKD